MTTAVCTLLGLLVMAAPVDAEPDVDAQTEAEVETDAPPPAAGPLDEGAPGDAAPVDGDPGDGDPGDGDPGDGDPDDGDPLDSAPLDSAPPGHDPGEDGVEPAPTGKPGESPRPAAAVGTARPATAPRAQSAPIKDDPRRWTDESPDDEDDPTAAASGPIDFWNSPWAAALLAAGAAGLTAILYGAVVTWGTGELYRRVPTTPAAVLFAAFLGAPVLPAAAAGVATFVVRPWWESAAVVGAGLAGGAVGLLLGFGLFFTVGPFLPDPQLFIWFTLLGLPLVATIASATGTATLLPIGRELWEDVVEKRPRDPTRRETPPVLKEPRW